MIWLLEVAAYWAILAAIAYSLGFFTRKDGKSACHHEWREYRRDELPADKHGSITGIIHEECRCGEVRETRFRVCVASGDGRRSRRETV